MRPAVTIFACLLLATASLAAERPLASRKRCSGTLGVILQDPISPSALPAARPPAWPLCRWRCAAAGTRLTALPSGALVARVVHKPIPGLTPAMLTWWFNGNVDGDMRHPLDNNVYPRYHVWHPRDHIQQSTLRAGPTSGNATGATWSIVEFFNSALPGGYVAGHDSCDWKDELFTNVQLKVQRLDENGLTLGFDVAGQKPLRLTHQWSASPEGLRLTSTMFIGFPEDNVVTRLVNRITKRAFGGRDAPRAARIWQEHCLEEMSNLQYFLPQLFASQNQETVSTSTPAAAAAVAAQAPASAGGLALSGGGAAPVVAVV